MGIPQKSEITIVCKEYDKYGNRKSITYIVKRNATGKDINLLSLRSRLNPELQYYATNIDKTDEEILHLAKTKPLKEPLFVRI